MDLSNEFEPKASFFSHFCEWLIVSTLQLIVVFVPLFFLVKNEEVFEFNKMLFTYACTVIIATAWLCKSIFDKKFRIQKTPLDWFIVLFFLSQLISTALSLHPRTSIFGYYTRFHGGLLSIVTYITLFYATATFVKKKNLNGFLIFTFIGAFLATAYAFPEHFGHSPSCLLLTNTWDANCWVQDVQSRVFGTFGQPNWLAAFIVLLLPLSWSMVYLFPQQKGKKWWLLGTISLGLTGLMFATLLFTKSRSGILGFVASVLVYGIIVAVRFLTKKSTQKSSKVWLGGTLLLIFLVAMIFGTPFTPSAQQLFQSKTSSTQASNTEQPTVDRLESGGTDSGEIRQIVWKGALNVWKRYPFFGSGVETFAYSYYRDRPMEHNLVSEWDFLYNKAHNELLNFLATTGIVGLITYLLLQAVVCWFLFKEALFHESKQVSALSTAVLAGLIALHISNFFGFSTVMITILMYVLPAIVISADTDKVQSIRWNMFSLKAAKVQEKNEPGWLITLTQRFWKPKVSKSSTVSIGQWVGVSIVIMAGLFYLFQVFTIWLADHYYAQAKEAYKNDDFTVGLNKIKLAIDLSSKEALYYELYSKLAAAYAITLLQQGDAEVGTGFANSALEASNTSLILNPVHLNFYKSRNQVLVTLAQAQPQLYDESLRTLQVAETLSPTDPKLVYFEGLIKHTQGKDDEAIEALKKSIEMKPNYDSPRYLLGQIYEAQQKYPEAKEQYQYVLDKINPGNEQIKERLEYIATMEGKKK